MGPVAHSAFEIYQQQMKKRAKKYEKRARKQRLQRQFVVTDSKGSSVSYSQNEGVQKEELSKNNTERTSVVRAKAKALKRLSGGTHVNVDFQGRSKQRPKKVRISPAKTTDESFTDTSFDSPEKKAKDDSDKKAGNISGKKVKDDSGKKAKDDSVKKVKNESVKKAKDDTAKKAKDDIFKKAKDDSVKKAKKDSVKKAEDDSASKAKNESVKKAKDDTAKKTKDDIVKKAKDDSSKNKDDYAIESRVDPEVVLNGCVKNPVKSQKRSVIEDDSISSDEEETPPKQMEKKRRRKGSGNEIGKIPKFLEDEFIPVEDSTQSGREVLQWLITPIQIQPFLEKYWEQRPLFISRAFHRNFLQGILSSEDIDNALRENSMQFTKNVDVTSYVDGVRETHNPVGRAHAFTVWDYYRNGCSVRILNPQTYFKKLRKICTTLQECFNSFVGANVYLTPPNSQGFAPHYDDIEAFVLQLEGKKKWKVYQPRKGEKLPRVSSRNFTEEEMEQPVLEIELQPGDLLYMPRGYFHQASTVPNTHSLHVTISTYQHSSWADVMEKVVQGALASAIETDPEFREGIPWDFLQNTGVVFSTDRTPRRKQIMDKMKRLFGKLIDHAPLDATADQMAKEFLHESLPPMLQSSEVDLTVHGSGVRMKNGDVGHLKHLSLKSSVKLIRQNVLRLVSEGDDESVNIYHCAENPLVYKEEDPKWCEVELELAPAVEALIRNYPEYTCVEDLPVADDSRKLQVVMSLWERGILISEEPVTDVSLTED